MPTPPKREKKNEWELYALEETIDKPIQEDHKGVKRTYEQKHGIHLLNIKSSLNSFNQKIWAYACDQENCPFKVRLLCLSPTKIEIWTAKTHVHNNPTESVEKGIPYVLKLSIHDDVNNGIKPRKIHLRLKEKLGEQCPTYEEIRNCVYYYRRTRLSEIVRKSKLEFDEWIGKHTTPATPETCFVLDFEINEEDFLICLSSPKLMYNAIEQSKHGDSVIFLDSTYKLINSSLLLMVVGTQTLDCQFRPIAFQISLHENTDYYTRFVGTLKEYHIKVTKENWEPKYVMSDFDESISNAITQIFPKSKQLKCFFHLKKNVKRKISELKLEDSDQILEDIQFLSEIDKDEDFSYFADLFLKKWSGEALEKDDAHWSTFRDYFENQYLNKERMNWFVGSSPSGIGNTNNSLESFNKSLKGTYFPSRLDIGEAKYICESILI